MTSSSVHTTNRITILNVLGALVAFGALIAYVAFANSLASQAWHIADAQDTLTKILDERNALVAQQSAFEDRTHLTQLAQEVGMVPTGAVVYLMQDSAVAAR